MAVSTSAFRRSFNSGPPRRPGQAIDAQAGGDVEDGIRPGNVAVADEQRPVRRRVAKARACLRAVLLMEPEIGPGGLLGRQGELARKAEGDPEETAERAKSCL